MPRRKRGVQRIHQSGLSQAYKRSCDAWKRATTDLADATRLYKQENSISYDEFFKAQISYGVARKRFDEAFDKEHRRSLKCAKGLEN